MKAILFVKKREKNKKCVLCQNVRTLQKRIERTKAISKEKSTTITCSEKTLIEQISLENESCRSNDVDRAISPLIVHSWSSQNEGNFQENEKAVVMTDCMKSC